jgi:hypothetical protein
MIDLETFSETPITHGTWAYAESAEILLLAYAWDDDEVQVVEFPTPGMMQSLIDAADRIIIHNSHFDRTVLSFSQVRVPTERIYDTLAVGLLHSLPGALDKQCEVLGVPLDKAKDKAGKKLIQLFCKPQAKTRKIRRATKETHPAEWEAFKEYARMDIVAMREVYARQPKVNWTDAEKAVWRLDQAINDRGIQIDMDLAHAALRAAKEAGQRLATESALMTNGAVPSATQRDALINYLRDTMGLEIDDLRKGTLGALLKTDVPDDVRELLEVRLQAAATSPAKYRVLVRGTSSDGRLRGTMQYAGASRTARWGGRLFQPQNLPRPTLKQPQIDLGIDAMKAGVETVFYDDVMELCASAVRGSIVAGPGCKLVVADLSNIEGRVLAWLAGEQWKLEAFKDFDAGIGHDIYKITAGGILGKDPGAVTKDERQVSGKVPELACFGPDTQVLTQNGPVAIKDITVDHWLWDGQTWVKHLGLIDRGNRQVMLLDGVEITPDHGVLCGETWRSAKMVASCQTFRDLASATGSASLKSLALTSARGAGCEAWSLSALVARLRTPLRSATFAGAPAHGATVAPRKSWPNGGKTGSDTPMYARTTTTGVGSATAYPPASTAATTRTTQDSLTTAGVASTSTNRGERTEQHTSPTSWGLTAGTSPNSNSTGLMSTEATSPETFGSSLDAPIGTTSDGSGICNSESMRWRPVYDIAHAGPRNRFTILTDSGALVVHNCGYQGSVGAFAAMGAIYGVSLPEPKVLEIVKAWRAKHKATVKFWYDCERAARNAISNPGEVYRASSIAFRRSGGWLRARLPSGRYLCYPSPQVDEDGRLSYMGTNQYTRRWERLDTYGGKLAENLTQAVARDVLTAGLLAAEAAGYDPVLHIHDEILCETPDDPAFSAQGLAALMSQGTQWSVGLPLAAAGFETYRYKKED